MAASSARMAIVFICEMPPLRYLPFYRVQAGSEALVDPVEIGRLSAE